MDTNWGIDTGRLLRAITILLVLLAILLRWRYPRFRLRKNDWRWFRSKGGKGK